MDKLVNNKEQFDDLGQVQLNQNGRPKQAVVLYELTPEMIQQARQKIDKDTNLLPQNKYNEAKQRSAKVWNNFYSNHKCNFFKDRNYLQRQIRQIAYFREKHEQDKQIYTYLQLGCGVGNTLFPLLREYSFFNYQGCDISAQAIKLIQQQMEDHPTYKDRLEVKVCDLVKDEIPFQKKPDLLSMIFVLSAIVPEKHQAVIDKIAKWMKPGSCFFFRDYGRYDFGQVNMSNKGNRKLKDNFYVKHDGVCVYYFQQSEIEEMLVKAGLQKAQGSIHCRLLQNRKTGLKMYRIWVQARYYKPPIQPFFLERIQKQAAQKQKKVQQQNKLQQKRQQKPQEQNKQLKQQKIQQSQLKINDKIIKNTQKQKEEQIILNEEPQNKQQKTQVILNEEPQNKQQKTQVKEVKQVEQVKQEQKQVSKS